MHRNNGFRIFRYQLFQLICVHTQIMISANISTGEGGMLVTNNEELYHKLKLMRSHGMTVMSYQRASGHATSYDIIDLGYNYRMDDIRASIGIIQLDKLR